METSRPHHLAQHLDAVLYVETSIPPGMTIGEYRRSRSGRQTRWERLKRLGAGAQVAAAQRAAVQPV
jgi:hypothetical protein